MSTSNDSRHFGFGSTAQSLSISASTHQVLTTEPVATLSTLAEPMLATNATVVTVQLDGGQEIIAMRLDSKLLGIQEETRRANDLLNSRR